MKVTRILSAFVKKTRFEDIPAKVLDKAKCCFLDFLGCGIAGIDDQASRLIVDYVGDIGSRGKASIIGRKVKTDTAHAALANGTIGHSLDYDDYHNETITHATATCLPAVLSVAEEKKLSGADVLLALILGNEISLRLGLGLTSYSYEKGWHTTSTAGRFGATAAAAKLLCLQKETVMHALGICGTQTAGFRQVFGTMCKAFNAGKAAMDGVMSAKLAEKGFTSSKEIIEGEMGLFQIMTENPDEASVLEGLGSHYHMENLSFKPYPTCA